MNNKYLSFSFLVAAVTLAGISSLIYEVLWIRQLGFALGSTAVATSIMLTAFLGGLAIGSMIMGRFADTLVNPFKTFVIVEVLAALAGLAVVIAALSTIGSGAGAAVGFAVVALLILAVGIAFQLYVGITGVKNASNPYKGDTLFKLGIVLIAIQFVSFIINIASTTSSSNTGSLVVGFLLPVLFTYGAYQLKKQLG